MDGLQVSVGSGDNDGEGLQNLRAAISFRPQAGEREQSAGAQADILRNFSLIAGLPFVISVGGYQATLFFFQEDLKVGFSCAVSARTLISRLPRAGSFAQEGINPQRMV